MRFFRWHIPVNARTSCFGSTSIAKTSRLLYHSISTWPIAKHADLENSGSGNMAALMFVYRYILIIGGSIRGNGCCFGYRYHTRSENQYVLAMQTRNSAPKLLPLSGFKTIVQIYQYLSYGGLDFQVVRVYNPLFNISTKFSKQTLICIVHEARKCTFLHKDDLVLSTCYIVPLWIYPSLSIYKLQPSERRGAWIFDYGLYREN